MASQSTGQAPLTTGVGGSYTCMVGATLAVALAPDMWWNLWDYVVEASRAAILVLLADTAKSL
jgi:hypothetical protein